MKFESKSGWNLLQPVKRRALDKSKKRTLAYSVQTKISMMIYQILLSALLLGIRPFTYLSTWENMDHWLFQTSTPSTEDK